ncbi:hypothetical protein ACS5PK_09595 [Roseateles sp. DB2]|uniref:hypothetical protein n=1 Tax=Roseateles sp. DB2 TaxID=3453717 RepID=UPI003EEFDB94
MTALAKLVSGAFCRKLLSNSMILIISFEADAHANIVSRALQSIGHRCEIRGAFGFPSEECISLQFPKRHGNAWIGLDDDEISVIWYRRDAVINRLSSIEANRMRVIEQEYIAARRACYSALGRFKSLWVNDWKNAWAAEEKLLQLQIASSVGFEVPDTLISNDPAEIRSFCSRHEDGGVVHKMFRQASFGHKTSCTALVTPTVLANDKLLSGVPGIYQRRVDLEFDIRVLVAGQSFISARLQTEDKRFVDSRVLTHRAGCVHPWDLDERTKAMCLDLMKHLGLVSGSIDLGVTKNGEIVFFEVNQAGNFLWAEQANPDLPLLDFYCDFLISGDPDFEYKPGSRNGLTFASFVN